MSIAAPQRRRIEVVGLFGGQVGFFNCHERISGYIGGVGSGKTHVLLRKALWSHMNLVNRVGRSKGCVIYPTYDLADELFFDPFKELLDAVGVRYKFNATHRRLVTRYGSIKGFQLQSPKRIVGSEWTWCAFDEFDVENWRNCDIAFHKAVARMRGCANSEMFFASTPEGHHYLYKIFVKDNQDGARKLFRGRTVDNPHLPPDYAPSLQANYDERLIKAYMEGEFVNLTQGQVYHAFSRDANVRECELLGGMPVTVQCDFNASSKPMCWNVGQLRGDDLYITHALARTFTNTHDMCIYLHEELGQLPPQMDFYGDYSGNAASSSSTLTDWQIIEEYFTRAGVRVRTHYKPCKSVRSGVNAVNARLKAADGQHHIFISPRARHLIEDLELTVWDATGTKEDQADNMRSHSVSALRYWCDIVFPLMPRINRVH